MVLQEAKVPMVDLAVLEVRVRIRIRMKRLYADRQRQTISTADITERQ